MGYPSWRSFVWWAVICLSFYFNVLFTTPKPYNVADYSYEDCPLTDPDNEIRILTLYQGLRTEPIQCELKTRRLTPLPGSNETRYEALSYFWGSDRDQKSIEILNNQAQRTRLMVRPNLHSAMEQLRYRDRPRDLWIDAICINQQDNREKNFQVPLMPKIYTDAANVCVWLGTASENSSLALSFIKRVLNLDDTDRAIVDIRTTHEWPALASLMRREWFSRRWVIQEIALAKQATLHCGDMRTGWSEFAEAISILEAVRPEDQIMSNTFLSPGQAKLSDFLNEMPLLAATRLVDVTNNIFRKSDEGKILEKVLSLEALISEFSSFRVSRPHDVIYAVLSLAKDICSVQGPRDSDTTISMGQANLTLLRSINAFKESINTFRIDYDQDFLDVYKDFLKMTISNGGSLDMLCRPWAPVLENRVLPSWLMTSAQTTYSVSSDGIYYRTNADILVGNPGQGKRNYNASGKTKANNWHFGKTEARNSLFVEGFIVDKVGLTMEYSRNGLIPNEWLDAGGWKDLTSAPPPRFWKTLVANRGPKGSNCPRVYPRACKVLIPVIHGDDISTNTLLEEAQSIFVGKFLRRVQAVICMRRLFKTELRHFLGLAPKDAQSGDLICILFGCSVPVVLRSVRVQETEDQYYKFVGECYVHGLMEGEAFDIQRQEREAKEQQLKHSNNPDNTAPLTTKRTFELR